MKYIWLHAIISILLSSLGIVFFFSLMMKHLKWKSGFSPDGYGKLVPRTEPNPLVKKLILSLRVAPNC